MTVPASKKPSHRQRRVGATIHRALADLLRRRGTFSARLTISEVRLSADMRYARIFIHAEGPDDFARNLEALAAARKDLQKALARLLKLRFTPILSFAADPHFERAQRLERILQSPKVAADLAKSQP